ncbi:hypothetical protein [Streptomyces sp. NPDC001970]
MKGARPPWLDKLRFQHGPGGRLVLPVDGGDGIDLHVLTGF